ncbi:head-tail connector protein [Pseudaestuariivita sp.]|uniref:head-tail connector protein n=1 Tax=Pseudaestuariivita sp. TaxID=2211669 RepID=UPI004058313B
MMLVEETQIAEAALPVAEFKAHLRLGSGFAEDDVQDAVLVGFLRAALAAIEARTGKALLARSFVWMVTGWRDAYAQVMPIAPVTAVTDVVVVAGDGARTAQDAADFVIEPDTHRPRLVARSAALPQAPAGGWVEVTLTAGLGAGWADLPADMQQAVLMLAAHYYEYRYDVGLAQGCMPFGVTSLIERYRALRLFGGAPA